MGWREVIWVSLFCHHLFPMSMVSKLRTAGRQEEKRKNPPRGGFLNEDLTIQVCLFLETCNGNHLSPCCRNPACADFHLIHTCSRNASQQDCSFLFLSRKTRFQGDGSFMCDTSAVFQQTVITEYIKCPLSCQGAHCLSTLQH